MIVPKICFTIRFLFVQIINRTSKVHQQSPYFFVYYFYLNSFLTPVTSKLERLCFDIVALRSFEFRDWGHKHCNSNALRFCYLIVVYVPSL